MTSRMFPFITHTVNPVAGGFFNTPDGEIVACPYSCSYCWARTMINRYKYPKYQGPYRIHPAALKNYKQEDFPFVQDMTDIGAPGIPKEVIFDVIVWAGSQPCPMLFLSKNPGFYLKYLNYWPENAVLGATIESDLLGVTQFSKAPAPISRLNAMIGLKRKLRGKRKLFVSIEPIMRFSGDFVKQLRKIEPWGVAVGYDNYKNGLPEPSLAVTKDLIAELEDFTTVYIKTLRDPLPTRTPTPKAIK